MKITLDIDENIYPKITSSDNKENVILFLLNIGYQNIYSSVNENNIINDMNNICRKYKDDIISGINLNNSSINDKIILLQNNIKDLNQNNKIDELSLIINKLFGVSNSSNKKGEISENLIYNYFKEKYKNYSYEIKRHISHNADGELITPSNLKTLVEIKNYTNTVNKDEIDKFKYDLKYTNNNYGIFISLQSGIAGKNIIDYECINENNKTYQIIYISKLIEDITKLDYGILLLESLFKINKKENIDVKINQIKETIYYNFNELELIINKTHELRNEYQLFEKNIKLNLDSFYNKLRSYEIEQKDKMQKIWLNLFDDLSNIKDYVDCKIKILSDITDKDKNYIIISRLFDIFDDKKINVITVDNNNFNLFKNKELIGNLKRMKDKININLQNSSINIIFKNNNDDSNYKFLKLLL